jgi:hypothetical protein
LHLVFRVKIPFRGNVGLVHLMFCEFSIVMFKSCCQIDLKLVNPLPIVVFNEQNIPFDFMLHLTKWLSVKTVIWQCSFQRKKKNYEI